MNIFSKTLLEWYSQHRRDLPWRDTRDPYRIWISEIILQQTRVVQGYAYFQRFMQRFPDVTSLAAASQDEVLKLWQGLGYYSRARNLHAAACSMKGQFPTTYEGVRALKGVGDYTAAAICSFAYHQPYAVVDGNVYRVLSRYFDIDTPIDTTAGKKLFAVLAQEMLCVESPADYNQAIMDFGALQCTPQQPQCVSCPLADSCGALASGRVQLLPVKQHKAQTVDRYFNYIYVRAGAYIYLHQRKADDIWKNLYEFPLIETDADYAEAQLLASPQFQALFAPGEHPVVRLVQRSVKHVLSHRIIRANFYEVSLPECTDSFSDYLRVSLDDLENYAVSRLIHQFLEKYT